MCLWILSESVLTGLVLSGLAFYTSLEIMSGSLRALSVLAFLAVAYSDCGSSLDCVQGTLADVQKAAEARAKEEGKDLFGSYDCLSGLQDFVSWQPARKEYCCATHGLGCPGAAGKTIFLSSGEVLEENVADEFAEKFASGSLDTTGWSYSAETSSGESLPSWLSFDPETLKLTGTAPDSDLATDVSVKAVNKKFKKPVIAGYTIRDKVEPPAALDVLAIKGHPMNYPIPPSAFGSSTAPKTFEIQALPGDTVPKWVFLDSASGTLSGVPSETGQHVLQISASNADETKTQVLKLRVEESGSTDAHGVAASHVQLPSAVGEVGTPLEYTLPAGSAGPASTVSREDGEQLPSWLKYEASSGTFSGIPPGAGDTPVQVKSSNAVAHFKVTIHAPTSADTKEAPPPKLKAAGQPDAGKPAAPAASKSAAQAASMSAAPAASKPAAPAAAESWAPPADSYLDEATEKASQLCVKENVVCEPLDMNLTPSMAVQYTKDAEECQVKCRGQESCGCFSFYKGLKLCHFASTMASLVEGRVGWQGGKAFCDKAMTGAQEETAFEQLMTESCLAHNVSFAPKITRPTSWPTTAVGSVDDCRSRCSRIGSDCRSFVFNTFTKSCDVQDMTASVIIAPAYEMAGPRVCNMRVPLTVTIHHPPKLLC